MAEPCSDRVAEPTIFSPASDRPSNASFSADPHTAKLRAVARLLARTAARDMFDQPSPERS
jgi:hypothetical protein